MGLNQGCQIFHGKKIPNGHKIYQHLPLKGPPKFTQIWDFLFENKPSGNPGSNPRRI
jgi:hypothetical protein